MTIASKGAGGSVNSASANQSSLALTTATTAGSAGDFAILLIAVDNNQTTDGDEGAVSSVTSTSNTWSKAAEFTNGQGSAQAGATCSVWYCNLDAAIATSSTITINFTNNTSRDASAATLHFFTKASGTRCVLEGTPGTLANDGAAAGSLNVTTANVSCLRVRAIASESSTATALTKTAAFTAVFTQSVTGTGASAANIGIRGEYLVSTATGQASAPTGGAGAVDNASVYVAFRERIFVAADAGSYALTGTAASVLVKRKVVASAGSYALTGTPATLYVDRRAVVSWAQVSFGETSAALSLAAGSGSYAVTGTAATLKHGWVIAAGSGSYALTGTAATLRHGYALSAVSGSYAVTGTNASLLHGWRVSAAAGSYSLTGTDATLTKLSNKSVAADAGSYALTGTAASLLHGWKLAAGAGSYALTGTDAALKHGWAVSAVSGSYALTGTAASLLHGWRITVTAGSYALTGSDATLTINSGKFVVASPGSYSLTGSPASLLHKWVLAAGSGSYAVTGTDATFRLGKAIAAGSGSYQVTGSNASLLLYRKLSAGSGSYSLGGTAATLINSGDVVAPPDYTNNSGYHPRHERLGRRPHPPEFIVPPTITATVESGQGGQSVRARFNVLVRAEGSSKSVQSQDAMAELFAIAELVTRQGQSAKSDTRFGMTSSIRTSQFADSVLAFGSAGMSAVGKSGGDELMVPSYAGEETPDRFFEVELTYIDPETDFCAS